MVVSLKGQLGWVVLANAWLKCIARVRRRLSLMTVQSGPASRGCPKSQSIAATSMQFERMRKIK
eukprot:3853390-Amphidinium_carterae.1